LAEIYRYTYLGQPRAFTWVLAMILVAVLVVMVSTVRKARAAGRVTSSQRGWAPTVLTAPSGLGD
jgi:ABC-type Fe3+ transport system permease subunit